MTITNSKYFMKIQSSSNLRPLGDFEKNKLSLLRRQSRGRCAANTDSIVYLALRRALALETLDYTIHVGSTPTFLYFDVKKIISVIKVALYSLLKSVKFEFETSDYVHKYFG